MRTNRAPSRQIGRGQHCPAPWRQLEYDAGMFFICYPRDPRTGFIEMWDKMAKCNSKLNQFWTHEGSGLFAYPRGARKGEYIGQRLFESR